MYQKGHIALLPLIFIILIAIGAVLFVSIKSGSLPSSLTQIVQMSTPQPANVTLTQTYQNPFDKETQYVNPFSEYKNPFDALK